MEVSLFLTPSCFHYPTNHLEQIIYGFAVSYYGVKRLIQNGSFCDSKRDAKTSDVINNYQFTDGMYRFSIVF